MTAGQHPGTLLSEHSGLVRATVGQVREAVLSVPTGRLKAVRAPLILAAKGEDEVVITGGPDTFHAHLATTTLTIDRGADWIQARGQWWWCARYHIAALPDGTLITLSTYNRATGLSGALVPFTIARHHRRDGRRGLQRLLDDLTERHRWRTSLLPD